MIRDWAGVPFLVLGVADARRLRLAGLFAFVRHGGAGDRAILLIDQADLISAAAGPAHGAWDAAREMGLNEVHVNLAPMTRLDRLQLAARIARACAPPLNRPPAEGSEIARRASASLAGASRSQAPDPAGLGASEPGLKTREPDSPLASVPCRRISL